MGIFMIMNIWMENRTFMVLESKTTSVFSIPFPALTVCSSRVFSMTTIDEELFNKAMALDQEYDVTQLQSLPANV